MAAGFNLTAQLNLKGPTNVSAIVADIKKQLGSINASVNLTVAPAAAKNIAQLNTALQSFNQTLTVTTTNATATANAIRNLGTAIGSINSTNLPQTLNNAATATNKLAQASANNSRQLASSTTEMREFGRQAGLAFRRFSAITSVTTVIYGLTNAVNNGIRAYIDYDKELIKLQQVTGQSASGLKGLENTITSLATSLGVGSAELTQVSSTLAQAGLSARDTERALKALALSSLAPSFDSMNETVEGSIALMRQFGIDAGDLEKALGSVNSVAAKFAVEAADLITAIQRTGGVFATASKGVSEGTDALNEFLAVFTSIRATTRESAETIATGLRTIFTRIQRGDTIQALKEYGVNLQDLDGKFVGAYKAVELLSKGLGGLDPRDLRFSKIIEELGGFRQIGKVIPLIQQFATAQDALKVAQTGQGSLTADAAKAQQSLAVQISKVREEFLALFRDIGKSDSFQAIAKGALSVTSALIKAADSIKGILPVLGVMLAFKGASAAVQFGSGFFSGIKGAGGIKSPKMNSGGIVRRYATGGLVPGSGDTDSIDAKLTPGEFVMTKQAVKAIGSDKLHRINKYAAGGPTKPLIEDISYNYTYDGDGLNVDYSPTDYAREYAQTNPGTTKLYKDNKKSYSGSSRLMGIDTPEISGSGSRGQFKDIAMIARDITEDWAEKQSHDSLLQAFQAANELDFYDRPMFKAPTLEKKLKDLGVAKNFSTKKGEKIPADIFLGRIKHLQSKFPDISYDDLVQEVQDSEDIKWPSARSGKQDTEFFKRYFSGGMVQKFAKGGAAKTAESILLSALKQQQSTDPANTYFKSDNTTNSILGVSGVDKILAQIEKTYGVSSAKFLGSGGENVAFDIGDEVLKISRTGLGIQTLAKDFGVKKKELDKMGNYQLPTGIDGVTGYRKVKTFGKLTAALQDKVVSRDTYKAMKDAQLLQGKLAKEGKYWLDADGSNMGYDKKGKPTVIDGLIFDKSFVDKMGPDYREDIEVEGMMAEAAYDKSLKKRKPQKKSLGGMIQKFAEGGKAIRRVGIIDSDVIRDIANTDKVSEGMKELGSSSATDYTLQLAKMAVQARKSDNLRKFRAIAGAAASGKSSLATGANANDNAALRQTIRSHILTPQDISNVDEIITITSTIGDAKLDAYLRDADRTYTVSSSTKEEQDLVRRNKQDRDTNQRPTLYGRKPGTAVTAPLDFTSEEAILMDELGSKNVVLGRRKDSEGNLTNKFRRKTGDELPEIVQASGFYTGGFAPPTRGHRGAIDQLLQNIVAKNPNATIKDIVVSVAPNLPMVAGTEGLAHAARYGIFDADFRSLLADINFKGAMISRDAQSTPGILPKLMEVPGENNRRKFARLKGAMAITSGKEAGVLGKYERAGINVTDIPRIEDISATAVRELLFSQNYEELDKIVNPEIGAILKGNQPQLKNRSVMVPVLLEEINKAAKINAELADKQVQDILQSAPGGPYGNVSKKLKESHPEIASQIEHIRKQRDSFKRYASGTQAYDIISQLASTYPDLYSIDPARKVAATVASISSDDAKSHIGDRVQKALLPEGTTTAGSSLLESIRQNVTKQLSIPKGAGNLPTDSKTITSSFLNTVIPSDPLFGMFAGKTIDPGIVKKVWRQTYAGLSQDKEASYTALKKWLETQYNARTGTKTEELSQAIQESKMVGLVGMLPIGHEKLSGPFTWMLGKNAAGEDVSVTASIIERGLGKKYEEEIKAAQKHAGEGSELLASGLASKMKSGPSSLRSLDQGQLETLGQGNIEGAYLEQALARLWANLDNVSTRTRPIDYPDGLGESSELFPGISPTIPTEVKRTINSDSRTKAIEEFQRYFRLINGVPEPKEAKEAKAQKEVVKALSEGGEVQNFMAGGVATKTRKPKEPFGTGETEFPTRISKKYAEEQHSASENLRSKLAWEKYPKDERIMVNDEKVQESFQQPFDREKFASSFKEKISRDSLFERMSDFAKFVGLPQEDLSVALPLQLDFGASKRGGGLGMFAAAQFEKGATGIRPYEGYDLSKFGYGEKQKQEAYGLEKLITAKEKEIAKIRKTPIETYDDGSFSFDSEAYSKANIELDSLKNKSFVLTNLKFDAEKAALAGQNATSSATGRGTISFAPSMGYSSDTKNSTLYHEMTHQVFEGLRKKSADSFNKYRERVSSLFSGDNDDLADAFDALTTNGGYSSADVVYGRSYKSNNLSQILSSYYRQNLDSSRGATPIPEDITKNLASLSTQSTAAKRAREYRPINPKVNEALLQAGDKFGMTQEKINRMEDNGKEEFLTTLIEKAPQLDQNLQGILDSTLTELLSGAGIQRQRYANGGKVDYYSLEKNSGFKSGEFDLLANFAKTNGFSLDEFKKYLQQRLAQKQQNSQLRMNPVSILRAITPETNRTTDKQRALADQLKGEPDAGYRPILTEAQRLAASRAETRASALADINNATRYAVGGVAEPEQKKEKEYGKISITEDGTMISAGYLKNDTRSGYATAYKMRDYLYYVGLSSATSGYGPRLYDVLMEAATEKGAMLTSDRSMVSGSAKNVWEYYFNNRSDVKKTPLKPSDWTRNDSLIDPKLYGKEDTWPPATDPAWILQSGYSKSPNLINSPDVIKPSTKPDSRAMALSYFAARTKPFADGGHVMAMLTPGEAVLSPESAAQIGKANLDKLNHAEKYVKRNSGGGISIVPGSGDGDTFGPVPLAVGSYVIRKKATAALGLGKYNVGGSVQKFATGGSPIPIRPEAIGLETIAATVDEIDEMRESLSRLGNTVSSFAKLLSRGGEVSYAAMIKASEADIKKLQYAGASIADIVKAEQALSKVRASGQQQAVTKQFLEAGFTESKSGKDLGSGAAQQRILEAATKIEKSITDQRTSEAFQGLKNGTMSSMAFGSKGVAGKSDSEIMIEAKKIANSQLETTKNRAFTSATGKVTGMSKQDLAAMGISGSDIQKYISQSMMDRKTLSQMDKQLLQLRKEEYAIHGTVKGVAVKSASEAEKLMQQELTERRKIVNATAKAQGVRGPGGVGLGSDVANFARNAYDRVNTFNEKTGINKAAGFLQEKGPGYALSIGALAGQGENIAGYFTNDKKKRKSVGSGLESALSTTASGIGLAASTVAIPVAGPYIAAIVLAGTALMALKEAVTAAGHAARQFEQDLRNRRVEDAGERLDKSLETLGRAPTDAGSQNQVLQDVKNLATENDINASANLKDAQAEKAKSTLFARLGLAKAPTLDNDDMTELAKQRAKAAEKAAAGARTVIESKMESGQTFEEIKADPGFKELASIIAEANVEFQLAKVRIENFSDATVATTGETREEMIAKHRNAEITKTESDAGFLARSKTLEAARAMDEFNKAGRALAMTFSDMARSFDSALGKVSYELNELANSTDDAIDALSGQAKIGKISSKDRNVLENPDVYDEKTKQETSKRIADFVTNPNKAGLDPLEKERRISESAKIEQLLNSDPEKIGRRTAGAVAGIVESNRKADITTVAPVAKAELMAQTADLPEQMREAMARQFDIIVNQVNEMKDATPEQKTNRFAQLLQDELPSAASNTAKAIKDLGIKAANFKTDAFNQFISSVNKAAQAQLNYSEMLNRAKDTRTESSIALREMKSGGSIGLAERESIVNNRVSRLTGGETDLNKIVANIQNKEGQRSALQDTIKDESKTEAERIKAIESLANLDMSINKNKQALDELANSTELASAAMNQLQDLQKMQADRLQNLDQILTSTPQELQKLNESLIRVQQRAMGINPGPSREARKAYDTTFRQTRGNRFLAMQAAQGQMAQDRGTDLRTMEQYKSNFILDYQNRNPGKSKEDAENQFKIGAANLRGQAAYESGAIRIPGVAQTIMSSVKPEIDPAFANTQQVYQNANDKQAVAQEAVGKLELIKSERILKEATDQLAKAFNDLPETFNKAQNSKLEEFGINVGKKPLDEAVERRATTIVPTMASTGKYIDFKPQGTDTVPAMLTPGEFVVNARATAQHLPLLKAINSGTNIVSDTVMMSDGGVVYLAGGTKNPVSKNRLSNVLQGAKSTYSTSESANKGEVVGTVGSIAGAVKEGAEFFGNNTTLGINRIAQAANVVSSTSSIIGGVTTAADTTQDSSVRTKAATDAAMATGELVGGAASMLSGKASPVVAVVTNAAGGVLDPNTAPEVPSPVKAGLGIVGGGTSSPGGSALSTKDTSEAQDETNAAFGSTASTAILGATVGTAIAGPAGTAPGAVVGAIAGAASESFKVGAEAAATSYRTSYGTEAQKTQRMEGALAASRTNAYMADNPGTQNAGSMAGFDADKAANNPAREKKEKESSTAVGTWSSGGLVYLATGGVAPKGKNDLQMEEQTRVSAAESRMQDFLTKDPEYQAVAEADRKAAEQKEKDNRFPVPKLGQDPVENAKQFKMTDAQIYAGQSQALAPKSIKDIGPIRSMADAQLAREAMARGMTIAEVRYEKQQIYLSRFRGRARAAKEKSLGESLLEPSERMRLMNKAMEAQLRQDKGGDPYADQRAAETESKPEEPAKKVGLTAATMLAAQTGNFDDVDIGGSAKSEPSIAPESSKPKGPLLESTLGDKKDKFQELDNKRQNGKLLPEQIKEFQELYRKRSLETIPSRTDDARRLALMGIPPEKRSDAQKEEYLRLRYQRDSFMNAQSEGRAKTISGVKSGETFIDFKTRLDEQQKARNNTGYAPAAALASAETQSRDAESESKGPLLKSTLEDQTETFEKLEAKRQKGRFSLTDPLTTEERAKWNKLYRQRSLGATPSRTDNSRRLALMGIPPEKRSDAQKEEYLRLRFQKDSSMYTESGGRARTISGAKPDESFDDFRARQIQKQRDVDDSRYSALKKSYREEGRQLSDPDKAFVKRYKEEQEKQRVKSGERKVVFPVAETANSPKNDVQTITEEAKQTQKTITIAPVTKQASSVGAYPKNGGGRTDDISEADQANFTIDDLITQYNDVNIINAMGRQIAGYRLSQLGIDPNNPTAQKSQTITPTDPAVVTPVKPITTTPTKPTVSTTTQTSPYPNISDEEWQRNSKLAREKRQRIRLERINDLIQAGVSQEAIDLYGDTQVSTPRIIEIFRSQEKSRSKDEISSLEGQIARLQSKQKTGFLGFGKVDDSKEIYQLTLKLMKEQDKLRSVGIAPTIMSPEEQTTEAKNRAEIESVRANSKDTRTFSERNLGFSLGVGYQAAGEQIAGGVAAAELGINSALDMMGRPANDRSRPDANRVAVNQILAGKAGQNVGRGVEFARNEVPGAAFILDAAEGSSQIAVGGTRMVGAGIGMGIGATASNMGYTSFGDQLLYDSHNELARGFVGMGTGVGRMGEATINLGGNIVNSATGYGGKDLGTQALGDTVKTGNNLLDKLYEQKIESARKAGGDTTAMLVQGADAIGAGAADLALGDAALGAGFKVAGKIAKPITQFAGKGIGKLAKAGQSILSDLRKEADLSLFTPKGLRQAGSEISSDLGQFWNDIAHVDLLSGAMGKGVRETESVFPMTGKIAAQAGEKLGQGFDVAKGIAGKGMEKAGQLGEKISDGIGNAYTRDIMTGEKALPLKDRIRSKIQSARDWFKKPDPTKHPKGSNWTDWITAPEKPPVTPVVKPPVSAPTAPVTPVITPPVKPPVSVPTTPVAPVVSPPVKPPVSVPTTPVAPRQSGFIDYIREKASDLYGGITGKTAQARRAAEAATEEALNLVEYSDDAKRYMSTLSKEQLASFRQLARSGTSTEKQAKLMKDSIESAARDNLRFLEGKDYLKHQQELIDLKVLTAEEVKDRMQNTGGSYTSLKGGLKPEISINPKRASETVRVHELTHYMDELSGHLRSGRGNYYSALQKQFGPLLERFLDSEQYEDIVDGLGSAYTGRVIREKPQELITILTQGKADKATKHLFTEKSTAQQILTGLWQARGYQKGGIVYASEGALVPQSTPSGKEVQDIRGIELGEYQVAKINNIYPEIQQPTVPALDKALDKRSFSKATDSISGITNDISNLIKGINKQTELVGSIGTSGTKEVFAKMSQNTISGSSSNNSPQYKADGGIVYASNGTLVAAKSIGTDTVPAMLTPGEFVVNRQAAQQHMPILQAINSGAYNQGGVVKYLAEGGITVPILTPRYLSSGGGVAPQYLAAGGIATSTKVDAKDFERAMESFGQKVAAMEGVIEKMGQHVGDMSNNIGMKVDVRGILQHTGLGDIKSEILNQANANALVISQQVVSSTWSRADTNNEGQLLGGNPDIPLGRVGGGGIA
jgi:hypothetical protein